LPHEFESRSLALIGSVVQDETIIKESPVVNSSLTFTIENLELSILGSEWKERPLDANATFVFVDPETFEQVMIGDYGNNENYFRIRLAAEMNNMVVIDANDHSDTSPLTINRSKGILVNGNIHLPNRTIDPTKYAWPGGKWKALIMSYDDGPAADEQLVSLFNANGIIGTFNLCNCCK